VPLQALRSENLNARHFRSEFVLKPVRRTTIPYALLA
jgi:hypothetical protein